MRNPLQRVAELLDQVGLRQGRVLHGRELSQVAPRLALPEMLQDARHAEVGPRPQQLDHLAEHPHPRHAGAAERGQLTRPGDDLRVVKQQGDRAPHQGGGLAHGRHGGWPGGHPRVASGVEDGGQLAGLETAQLRQAHLHHLPERPLGNPRNEWARQVHQARPPVQRAQLDLGHQVVEEKAREGRAPGQLRTEPLRPDAAHPRVGVFPFGQEHEARLAPLAQERQRGLERAPGRLAARRVAIETEDDTGRDAEDLLQVLGRGGGAERGHGAGEAGLDEGQHVHVALHDDHRVELPAHALGLVEPVELTALVEDRGLRGIQILRLAVVQHSPAEADGAPAAVQDGVHHPVAEAVVGAPTAAGNRQAGLHEVLAGLLVAAEGTHQAVPPRRGIPELEGIERGGVEAAAPQVLLRPARLGVLVQLALEVLPGPVEQAVEGGKPGLGRTGRSALLRDRHPGPLGEGPHRLRKVHAGVLHQEADGGPVGAAAEAVVELLARADGERRALLVVEGAAGLVVVSGPLQGNGLADQLDDVDPGQKVVDEGLGDATGHRSPDGITPSRAASRAGRGAPSLGH